MKSSVFTATTKKPGKRTVRTVTTIKDNYTQELHVSSSERSFSGFWCFVGGILILLAVLFGLWTLYNHGGKTVVEKEKVSVVTPPKGDDQITPAPAPAPIVPTPAPEATPNVIVKTSTTVYDANSNSKLWATTTLDTSTGHCITITQWPRLENPGQLAMN